MVMRILLSSSVEGNAVEQSRLRQTRGYCTNSSNRLVRPLSRSSDIREKL